MKEKFNSFMNEKFLPIATKISNQRHLVALREGLIASMALSIVGSIFILVNQFPNDAYQNFMISIFGESWIKFVNTTTTPATTGIISVVAAFTIAYYLVENAGHKGVPAGVISLSAFFVASTLTEGGWPTGSLDSSALFTAAIISLFAGEVYLFFVKKNIVIKLPDSVPPNIASAFTALIPGTVIISSVFLVKIGFALTPYGDIKTFIFTLIQTPLQGLGVSYVGFTLFEIVAQVLWLFGIHGHSAISPIRTPLLSAANLENLEAFTAGGPIPNIIESGFVQYVHIGGAGTALALSFFMAFMSKSKQCKTIGKLSLVPAIFNINEPLLFGMPIILNPYMMVPFILAPTTAITIAYVAVKYFGFPMLTGVSIPWVMPKIITGFLATDGNIMGSVLVIICMLAAGLIYYPFFKAWDKKCLKEEQAQDQEQIIDK